MLSSVLYTSGGKLMEARIAAASDLAFSSMAFLAFGVADSSRIHHFTP
jgi:hypothetical protein